MSNKIHQTALTYLSQRDYATPELKQKLLAKGYPAEEIEATVQSLQQAGLISDDKYTVNFVMQRFAKGYGPQKIRQDLAVHSITLKIDEILAITGNTWLETMWKVWNKRFKGKQPSSYKERAQQMRFLQYRGFTCEQITKFFDHHAVPGAKRRDLNND